MLLSDVYSPYGGLRAAGLASIGRRGRYLILRFPNGVNITVWPGEEIPLPPPPKQETSVYGNDCPGGKCEM